MRELFKWTAVGCALFIALTFTAMLLYRGARVRHRWSDGYVFFLDSLSDLGRTQTFAGHSNWPSMLLFCFALSLVGISLPLFFGAYAMRFAKASASRRFAVAGAAAAVIAGAGFIGVAVTPANLLQEAHNVAVYIAYRGFAVAVLFGWLASIFSKRVPRSVAIVFGAFFCLVFGYLFFTEHFQIPGNPTGISIGVVSQKLFVYASVITILIQSLILAQPARSQPVNAAAL